MMQAGRWLCASRLARSSTRSQQAAALTVAGQREEHAAESTEHQLENATQEQETSDSGGTNPLRHFQAFRGMDEYVDATLIHYDNKSPGDSNKS